MAEHNVDLWVVDPAAAEAQRRPSAAPLLSPGVDPRQDIPAIEEWFERFRMLCAALAAEARDESKRRFED